MRMWFVTLSPRWPASSSDLAEWITVGALSAWWTPIQPQTSYTIERDPCVSVIVETLTRFTDGLSCQWCSCFPMDVMYQPPSIHDTPRLVPSPCRRRSKLKGSICSLYKWADTAFWLCGAVPIPAGNLSSPQSRCRAANCGDQLAKCWIIGDTSEEIVGCGGPRPSTAPHKPDPFSKIVSILPPGNGMVGIPGPVPRSLIGQDLSPDQLSNISGVLKVFETALWFDLPFCWDPCN